MFHNITESSSGGCHPHFTDEENPAKKIKKLHKTPQKKTSSPRFVFLLHTLGVFLFAFPSLKHYNSVGF